MSRPARPKGHLLREDVREAALAIVVFIGAGLLFCAATYYF